jgi:radical SAM protein with 4Fe4S-binding SPASM domain
LQAADLGARRISILGAEPTRYRCISELARFMRSQDLEVEMFASGVGMTTDFASDLFENRVSVVLRMDSLDESRQDMLTGAKGSFKLIQETFRALREAGYPSDEAVLRVDALICRHNIDEAVTLWRWLRDRNVVPRFSIAAPQASAEAGGGTDVDLAGIQQVFAEIAEIERDEYGSAWDPSPRSWGNGCMRHKFSCLVRWQGDVVPCVGLRIPIGNIREQKLRDIIEDSEVLEDLRNHTSTMKGPCASCEESDICYGCRGAAYQATGDYLASDPFCWRNAERQDEIARLPIAAAELIPHEPPMRVVDDLVGTGERSGEVSVRVSEEMPFVGEDGAVDEAAYFEMMAQSIAALNGFKQLGRSASAPGGYLVGAQKLEVLGSARVGDTLNVSVYKETRFGKFGVVKGSVSRNDTVLARGEIKIWQDGGDVSEPAGSEE